MKTNNFDEAKRNANLWALGIIYEWNKPRLTKVENAVDALLRANPAVYERTNKSTLYRTCKHVHVPINERS